MSKKLSLAEQELSEDAIYYFKQKCSSPDLFTTRVKAFDGNGHSVFDDFVLVRLVEQYAWKEVLIIWEESGISPEDYRILGLYGRYSTTYNQMEFLSDNNQLKIYSNDSEVYILIDSI